MKDFKALCRFYCIIVTLIILSVGGKTAYAITEYAVPTALSTPYDITSGPDGNLWFTEINGNKIGKITTAGVITEYAVPTVESRPAGITSGPDGNIWFTESSGNKIGKFSLTFTVTPTGINSISIIWSSSTGAFIYGLERSASQNGPYSQISCGTNTSYIDRGLTPNTTYYYRVRAGSYTANCYNTTSGWSTPSSPVSATTQAPSPNGVSAGGDLNMSNVHTSSDYLKIWIDLSKNGAANNQLCGNGYFQIINGNSAVVTYTAQSDYTCTLGTTSKANHAKYILQFRIGNDGKRAAYFEDGKLQYCSGGSCSDIENGPSGFSFYGTTFDVSKHAWKFKNGSWVAVAQGAEIYNYAEKIVKNIDYFSRSAFWNSIGYYETGWFPDSNVSQGLCYGMTNSAIANFTHQSESDWWGKGGLSEWESDMGGHWDTGTEKAIYPYKPFSGNTIYPDTATTSWQGSSAKKAIYYHAAQSLWSNPLTNNWVGTDKHEYYLFHTSNMPIWKDVLKNGSPVSLDFHIDPKGRHAVAITSVLIWNNHIKYMIWDNNKPCPTLQNENRGHYLELYIDDMADPGKAFNSGDKHIKTVGLSDGKGIDKKYTFKSNEGVVFMARSGDSQNIYNLIGQSVKSDMPLLSAEQKTVAQRYTSSIIETGHIEVSIIGGSVTGVFNKSTGQQISLITNGEVKAGQAVQLIGLGGTMYKLYLPADTTYRIEATKSYGTPLLDIYANIPNTDGTITSLAYDSQTYLENSAEDIYFFAGRGNSDTTVRRVTRGTTYAPDQTQTVITAVGAPANFTGVFTVNNTVALNWQNPSHPNFSKVQIVRKEDSAPLSQTDGTVVYSGAAQTFADTGVTVGRYYFFSAYSVDTSAQYSAASTIGIDTTLGGITGYVRLAGGTGVLGATITLKKATGEMVNSTTANSQGYYALVNIPLGGYKLEAEYSASIIQDSPKSITIPDTTTADFTIAQISGNQPVLLIPSQTSYNTIQAAYDANTAASGSSILVQGTTLTEALVFSQNNNITLAGGYDSFTTVGATMTTVQGSLTISGGTVTVENLVIQ